jgi:hypothetical protein
MIILVRQKFEGRTSCIISITSETLLVPVISKKNAVMVVKRPNSYEASSVLGSTSPTNPEVQVIEIAIFGPNDDQSARGGEFMRFQ